MKMIVLALIVFVILLYWRVYKLYEALNKCLDYIHRDSKDTGKVIELIGDNIALTYKIIEKHLLNQHGIVIEEKEKKNE